jgi:hypothetical protein
MVISARLRRPFAYRSGMRWLGLAELSPTDSEERDRLLLARREDRPGA